MNSTSLLALVFTILIVIVLVLFLGLWLWGVIAVAIFQLPALTFWQFVGLIILLNILIPHVNYAKKD